MKTLLVEKIFLSIAVVTALGGLTIAYVTQNPIWLIGVPIAITSIALLMIWTKY